MNQQIKDAIQSIHLRIKAFAEEDPQKLSHILSAASKEDIVVEDYTPHALTKEVISIYEAYPDELNELMQGVTFVQNITPYNVGEKPRKNFSGGFGICDCASYTYAPNDACYGQCIDAGTQSAYCIDPLAKNYGESEDCKYGGSINWQSVGNTILDIADQIGFDNIFNALTNNEQEQPSGDTTTPPNITIGDKNKTDWGKVALYGGLLIALGVGIYFLVKKKK